MNVARVRSALLTVALAGVMALAAQVVEARSWLVAAVVVVVQLLIATAPSPAGPRGRSVKAPRFLPVMSAGLVAVALVLFPQVLDQPGDRRDVIGAVDSGTFGGVMPAIVVAVLVTAILQMLRGDGRRNLVIGLSYAVSLAATAALAAGWIGASQSLASPASVTVGALGVAVGALVWAIPGDRFLLGSLAVVLAGACGAAVPLLVDTFVTPLFGVAVAGGAAAFGLLGLVVGRSWVDGRTHPSAGWELPAATALALAAPVVYLGGQLVRL